MGPVVSVTGILCIICCRGTGAWLSISTGLDRLVSWETNINNTQYIGILHSLGSIASLHLLHLLSSSMVSSHGSHNIYRRQGGTQPAQPGQQLLLLLGLPEQLGGLGSKVVLSSQQLYS